MECGEVKGKPSKKSVTFNIVGIYDGYECGERTLLCLRFFFFIRAVSGIPIARPAMP
jgi:hypothetical protein